MDEITLVDADPIEGRMTETFTEEDLVVYSKRWRKRSCEIQVDIYASKIQSLMVLVGFTGEG